MEVIAWLNPKNIQKFRGSRTQISEFEFGIWFLFFYKEEGSWKGAL
jgi:hypothetical protein